jgi:photosystem II stability/assembly factor-like uncharacterized protein
VKYGALALLLAVPALLGAERWEMQYFHDENKSSLAINDLAFPSPQRGVAVGTLEEGSRTRGAAVVTSDGGAHWSLVRLDAPAISIFFLDDSTGWAVTTKGILQTEEGGRSWRKLPSSPKDVLRVWFFNAQHGYAVGLQKSIWETRDGGKRWTRIAASDQAASNPRYTTYNNIAFIGQRGMILGFTQPPRRDNSEFPDWMEPDRAARRRQWPNMLISLITADGGAKWNVSTVSIFGEVTHVRLAPDGRALTLVEFQHSFPYPSEVYALSWAGKTGERIYRDKERAVTDLALPPSGPAYLAAVEVPGKVVRLPVPSKLHILKSTDLKTWTEMAVDYRATGLRAVMAAADAASVWVATDTGMILKLAP